MMKLPKNAETGILTFTRYRSKITVKNCVECSKRYHFVTIRLDAKGSNDDGKEKS